MSESTVQSTPTDDVRKDGIDHFPDWKEKCERCHQCLHGYTFLCNISLKLKEVPIHAKYFLNTFEGATLTDFERKDQKQIWKSKKKCI